MNLSHPKILGIDPGSRIVGFACLAAKKANPLAPKDFQIVDGGVLEVDAKLPLIKRLGLLHDELHRLVVELKPTICVFEKSFYGENAATGIKLGQARGALLTAVLRCGVEVEEITPAQVKRMIAGHGRSDKKQVSMALKALMGFQLGDLPYDVSDALAIALSFALSYPTKNLSSLSKTKWRGVSL